MFEILQVVFEFNVNFQKKKKYFTSRESYVNMSEFCIH